jgi:hypothetical protein
VPLDLRWLTLCNGSVRIEIWGLPVIEVLLRNQTVDPLVARLSGCAIFAAKLCRILVDPATQSDADVDTTSAVMVDNVGRYSIFIRLNCLYEGKMLWHPWIGGFRWLDFPAQVLWGMRGPGGGPRHR